MAQYRTRNLDTIDLIAWRHYRTTKNRVVEQLFINNPGVADFGPLLPAGVLIQLPELKPTPKPGGFKLWD